MLETDWRFVSPDDGVNKTLWNIGQFIQDYTATSKKTVILTRYRENLKYHLAKHSLCKGRFSNGKFLLYQRQAYNKQT